jgi:hypothetical protein
MYEKISKKDFPHINRAIGAANYVRKIYDPVITFNKHLLPDLYCECIANGWERYVEGGDGDAVFIAAVRAGRRYMWNEIKIYKYDIVNLKRAEMISILQVARTVRRAGGGRISLSSAVRKAYIVQQRLAGRSFASIARELRCDDANVLYHFRSVIQLLSDRTAKLGSKPWSRNGKRGRWKR